MKTFKKNQIIIFVVSLMLITAGYLNYDVNNETQVSTNVIDESEIAEVGEAKLVNSNNISENVIDEVETANTKVEDDYFSASKLGRDVMYSQIIESYQKIIDNEGISQEQKGIATNEIAKINNTKNAIMIAENLIKTKDFKDVVIFVNDKSVNVILKCENIKKEQIAQIQNIVSRELKSNIEDIHISTK